MLKIPFFSKKSTQISQNSSLFWGNIANFINRSGSNETITPENSMQISAYWCAVRAISEDIAKLKIKSYKLDKKNRKIWADSPIVKTLTNGFNDETDSMTGIQTLVCWLLTFGNAYAEIATNNIGEIQLYLIHPTRVTPERNAITNKLQYRIASGDTLDKNKVYSVIMPEEDILHLRGLGNGIMGFSVGELAAQSLGIAMAAQKFTGSFFGNNLSIGTVLESPRVLDPDVKESIRQEWYKKFTGKVGGLAIVDKDFKISKLQMSSTDAELLTTRQFQIEEISRWFRIPPHKIMEMKGAKYANLEQNELNYITDTLTPWITRLERAFKFKFHRYDDIQIDIDEKGLARGDMQARNAYYTALYNISAISPNEIRELEGLPIVESEALNQYYQQLNMQSVEVARESQILDNQIKENSLGDAEKVDNSEDETIDNYKETMRFMLSHLVQAEYHAHNLTFAEEHFKKKCESNVLAMKEHLDKFYAKHNLRLDDSLKSIFSFLCKSTGAKMPNIKELREKFINMPKNENWQNTRVDEMIIDIINLLKVKV